MKKRCSGCTHWQKLTDFGLCTLKDGRANSGFSCDQWKGKKYQRIKKHNLLARIERS